MITPKTFEALVKALADRELLDIVHQRLTQKNQAIEVDIDDSDKR